VKKLMTRNKNTFFFETILAEWWIQIWMHKDLKLFVGSDLGLDPKLDVNINKKP
jgi:hypothetical protein